jgi:uncharacterized lipoprotein
MRRASLIVLLVAMTAACASAPEKPRYVESASAQKQNCMQTGSHVRTKQGTCSPAPGRTHSGSDIQRTGAGTAESLKVLNPAVDIHPH